MTIKVLSILFYALVIACFILGEYYYVKFFPLNGVTGLIHAVWHFSDSVLKLMTGILILYSLLKFKGFLKRMRRSNAAHFVNERLMTVHLSIFSLFILANFGDFINLTIYLTNYYN